MQNLFADAPRHLEQELFQPLLDTAGVRVERIVSTGHRSPEGFWYDQDQSEWVAVLQGTAVLTFENGETLTLQPGDHVNIPAHRKHRVESTSEEGPTIWLAVHYRSPEQPG